MDYPNKRLQRTQLAKKECFINLTYCTWHNLSSVHVYLWLHVGEFSVWYYNGSILVCFCVSTHSRSVCVCGAWDKTYWCPCGVLVPGLQWCWVLGLLMESLIWLELHWPRRPHQRLSHSAVGWPSGSFGKMGSWGLKELAFQWLYLWHSLCFASVQQPAAGDRLAQHIFHQANQWAVRWGSFPPGQSVSCEVGFISTRPISELWGGVHLKAKSILSYSGGGGSQSRCYRQLMFYQRFECEQQQRRNQAFLHTQPTDRANESRCITDVIQM